MLTLLLLLVILCIGCAIGLAVRRIGDLSASMRLLIIAPAAAALVACTIFGAEALRYDGGCSGWGENGAHPCSRLEFVLQDWELALIFSALPTLVAIVLALYVSSRSRRRAAA